MNASEARRLRELGEVAYNQERMAEAVRRMRANPERMAGLTAEQVAWFWFPDRTAARDSWGWRLAAIHVT